jgi:hypothetical protein
VLTDPLHTTLTHAHACAQIKLLKILACLGAGDKGAADNMYAVLADILRRANTGHTIGNAIVAEAVRTITAIYPNPALLQSGAHVAAPRPSACKSAAQNCAAGCYKLCPAAIRSTHWAAPWPLPSHHVRTPISTTGNRPSPASFLYR